MADGKGECCIARWGGGGHVAAAAGYDASKMDMIMLKFRPIAPKPVAAASTTAAASDGGSGSGSGGGGGGRHAKVVGGRGRKKTNIKENNTSITSNNNSSSKRCNNSNGRKRKSSSPDRKQSWPHDQHHQQQQQQLNVDLDVVSEEYDQKGADLTLLPLFPEAPDLSPTSSAADQAVHNMPFWLNFDNSSNKSGCSPTFEGNYNNTHVTWL